MVAGGVPGRPLSVCCYIFSAGPTGQLATHSGRVRDDTAWPGQTPHTSHRGPALPTTSVMRHNNPFVLPTLVLLLLTLLPATFSFNLETRAPVVKLGGDYVNSFFGFSVAQHRTGAGDPVILIGAPQDRNLQPGTERSGALYRCPLSSDTRDCQQVVTDGKRHNSGPYSGIYDGGLAGLQTPVRAEIKDGQWLGVAVSSQGRTQPCPGDG